MWRGDVRWNISVVAPFVWRCLNGSTMAPFPHPVHRTGQAGFPHPALGQDFTLSRATPSAASEHLLELIGFPISRSFTYCVCLELRSLPSTRITWLQRYCRPLRHLMTPGPSLTSVQLLIAEHAIRLPVLRALSLCTCCRHIPRRGGWDHRFCSCSPIHVSLPRLWERVGPRIDLFEACSAFTRVTACTLATSPYFVTRLSPKASTASLPPQLLRLLPAGASRRVGLSPTGKRRLSTAHPHSGRPCATRSNCRLRCGPGAVSVTELTAGNLPQHGRRR